LAIQVYIRSWPSRRLADEHLIAHRSRLRACE
jgi:hypothetical protein